MKIDYFIVAYGTVPLSSYCSSRLSHCFLKNSLPVDQIQHLILYFTIQYCFSSLKTPTSISEWGNKTTWLSLCVVLHILPQKIMGSALLVSDLFIDLLPRFRMASWHPILGSGCWRRSAECFMFCHAFSWI